MKFTARLTALPEKSLSVWISLTLITMTAFCILCFGLFWVNMRLHHYRVEVGYLQKGFSETKKLEIKNKILQVKDYIQWVTHNPESALSAAITRKARAFKAAAAKGKTASDTSFGFYSTIIRSSSWYFKIPVVLLSQDGEVLLEDLPGPEESEKDTKMRLTKMLALASASVRGEEGRVFLFESGDREAMAGLAAGSVNTHIFPGYKVVFLIPSDRVRATLQEFILDTVSRMRYSENEYIFINTIYGKALVSNGQYNREPVDIAASGSEDWVKIFRVQQQSVKYPQGLFHTYLWRKLSPDEVDRKTSFFSFLPGWNWIIGTGFYEDEIRQVIRAKRDALRNQFVQDILSTVVFFLVMSLLSYLLARHYSRRMNRNIEIFSAFFRRSALENIHINIDGLAYREFRTLASDANHMAIERRKAEEALRNSEAHYRYLFEKNPAPMLIYELGSLNMLAVNDAFTSHYGYSQHETSRMRLTDLYPPDEKADIALLTTELTGHAYIGEWHHIKKDGTTITIETHSHDILFNTRRGRVAVINDITLRKKTEEEIRLLNAELESRVRQRTLQLEATNRELEAYSYSISHDLRAPLRAILGFSQILSSRHKEALNEEGRQYMDFIVEASSRMERLINDLLHYSRLGRKSLAMHTVGLRPVLMQVLHEFHQELEEAGAEITIPEELPGICGNETLLHQVFSNLVGNSIKYRRPEVPLQITLVDQSTPDAPRIVFSDNGIGIPQEHWEKIFNVFQRLHDESTYPGTGIGLATVKKAMMLQGGSVRVTSVIGVGTDFHLEFQPG
ncbi:MAG TPA: ATP-binding protein [Bacteroidales bacterium]|nr:ATP-binding protein [Bacteroidales bacterium]